MSRPKEYCRIVLAKAGMHLRVDIPSTEYERVKQIWAAHIPGQHRVIEVETFGDAVAFALEDVMGVLMISPEGTIAYIEDDQEWTEFQNEHKRSWDE